MITAIYCDVDGCLVPGQGLEPDMQALGRVAKALEGLDVEFKIMSGRGGDMLEWLQRHLAPLSTPGRLPNILEGGMRFSCEPGRTELIPLVDPGANRELQDLARRLDPIVKQLGGFREDKESVVTYNPGRAMSPAQLHEQLFPNGTAHLADGLVCTVSNSAVDITASVSKGSALRYHCEQAGVALTSVCAIDDAHNGLSALELVGEPACPGNAEDGVKRLVRQRGIVAQSAYGDGVVEILTRLRDLRLVRSA